MSMTRSTLAATLFEQLGLNKREAEDMVDRFFEEIAAALEAGDGVKLSGFWQLHTSRQATASRTQSEDRPAGPDIAPTRGELSP